MCLLKYIINCVPLMEIWLFIIMMMSHFGMISLIQSAIILILIFPADLSAHFDFL
jgi:hypothetical protein